jgi:hypothetical protein
VNPDIFNRTYTAELLRASEDTKKTVDVIANLTTEHRPSEQFAGEFTVNLSHSFVKSERAYHRSSKTMENPAMGKLSIPRTIETYGKQHYLYDVFIAQCGPDIIVAVPYHGLAEAFFVQVDDALGGKGVLYEKLNITKLLIWLGKAGIADVTTEGLPYKIEIALSRCQLAYTDPIERKQDLQQLAMTGANIGASEIYSYLINPIIEPEKYQYLATPTLLGFNLLVNGVKKTSAITDRHGNFKLWIGPNATRIERVFSLLKSIESLEGSIVTTGSLPIRQSRTIRGEEE